MRCADMAVMCQMQYAIHANKNTLLKELEGHLLIRVLQLIAQNFGIIMRKINFFETYFSAQLTI